MNIAPNLAPPATRPDAVAEPAAHATADPGPRPPDERDVAGWLALLVDPGTLAEVRAPKVPRPGSDRPGTVSQFFRHDQLATMARFGMRLSGTCPGVYFTLNPVRPELAGGHKAAADADVTARRRVLIDCDPRRDPDALADARRLAKEEGRDFEGLSATDAEKAAAGATADAIRDELTARGWPQPLEADSGNGFHLVYAVDLPNDEVGRDLVRGMLESLAAKFSTDAVDVDRTVFNASRIVKLYGTAARKGGATTDRPHRPSRVVRVPTAFTPVPRELIEALAAEARPRAVARVELDPAPPAGTPIPPPDRPSRPRDERNDRWTPEARAAAYLLKCDPAISGEGGHAQAFKTACSAGPGFDLAPESFLRLLAAVWNPACDPPWSEAELRHKVEDAYRVETRRGWLLDAPRDRFGGSTPVPPKNVGGGGPPVPPPGDIRQIADADRPVNEAPDDPHRLARAVLAEFQHREGSTLVWHREAFFAWKDGAYRDDPDLTNRVVGLVKAEVDRHTRAAMEAFLDQAALDAFAPGAGRPSKPPVAPKVTRRLVADVLQALASLTSVSGQDDDPPFWIKPRPDDPAPGGIVATANGLVVLDAEGGPALRPHTPRFFSTFALPYRFEPVAPEPSAWLEFLDDLWGDDPASVRELRKWFGYCLTTDVGQHKILLLIGAPRSGKSTVKNVLTEMVGRRNVASTSAVALADRFGLEPLLDKTLAILGDARTADSHDAVVMMDRLLRISGGDAVEVNRKGRPMLHDVQLRSKFVIVSNEMPNLRDSSGANVERYLPLCTRQSFAGREDRQLGARLRKELPGILNWAIVGRDQLAEDGGFIIPASAEELVVDARALASPISEFMADECILGPGQDVTIDAIWERWKEWAGQNGHQPSHKHLFGRNLKAAAGHKIITDARPRSENNARIRVYKGIGVRTPSPF